MDGDRTDGPIRPDRSGRSNRDDTARPRDTETPAADRADEPAVRAGGTDR